MSAGIFRILITWLQGYVVGCKLFHKGIEILSEFKLSLYFFKHDIINKFAPDIFIWTGFENGSPNEMKTNMKVEGCCLFKPAIVIS